MALHHRVLTVEIVTDGDGDEMARLIAQYLTNPDGPFIGDYGSPSWGGYMGPFVRYIQVVPGTGEFWMESWTDVDYYGKVPL